MVRTSNDEAEDKKENGRKRSSVAKSTKKAPPSTGTGIWPCKMNGCTKQFAREADLKRHQRTTKLHSMPSFACPQCDATFTRTDALRRHQKSRHNGVTEAVEVTKEGEEPGQSSSRSSSTAPSSKGKERETSTVPMVPITEAIGGASTSSLATPVTSYYRQHTANNSNYATPRPAHYAPISLPTSSARGDTKGWIHPNPWPDGQGNPPMGPMQLMYIASPYYRTNAPLAPPPLLTPVSQTPGPAAFSNPHSANSDDSKIMADSPTSSSSSIMADIEANDAPPDPYPKRNVLQNANIASSTQHNPSTQNFDQILSPAGMDAFSNGERSHDEGLSAESNQQVERGREDAGSSSEPWGALSKSKDPPFVETHGSASYLPVEDGQEEADLRRRSLSYGLSYDLRRDAPEPMEHMLTEDGEPMLNPAELLTQARPMF
ncbi:hypothetical protein V5O48_016010 [Marasmius crinis-equi]|uniref:C2H2-type domain-containing protein n=1 Tax=Marasmius crinis-equi TaxID=585013 RepID=A0ABR3ESX7_9AGAR